MTKIGGAATRRTNQALFVLLLGAGATGGLMFGIGTGWNRWPTVAHGAMGVAVVALTPWKSAISQRGLRRRGLGVAAPSLALALTVIVTLATGFAHRAGARDLGPVLVQQVHVTAAVAALVLTGWHVTARPVPVRRTDLGRRSLLRGGLVLGGSTVVTVAVPHAGRRYTRSLERGSFDPRQMPVTQWLDDDVPSVDSARWRLEVAGRAWSLDELRLLERDFVATLDCTGGWYAHQRWSGVPLGRLLRESGARDARSIDVRSVTGYHRRFPARDRAHLYLAIGAGGEVLSPGHGAPARLVAPGRRGFWWVKWVSEIEPSDAPWWWQSPFPLT